MLTVSQQKFLEALIGPLGQITKAIKSFPGCHQSTKLLYFKRAVYQQGETFLNSIDKLFHPNLSEHEFQNLLEFVQMLKLLNDLCFNNLIDYQEQQSYPALLCYFGNESVDSEEIQRTIQAMVGKRSTEILSQLPISIFLEIQIRKLLEKEIQQNMEWRAYSNLPGSQRPLLDSRPRNIINPHLYTNSQDVANSVEEFEKYANLSQIDLSTRIQILKNFEDFRSLLRAQIQLKDFLCFSTHERQYMLNKAKIIILFLNSMNLYPKQFMKMPFAKKEFFLNAFEGINIIIYQISTRQSPLKEELELHLSAIFNYCFIHQMPLETQLVLPFPFRQLLYIHYDKVNRLVNDFDISLDKIIVLTYEPLEAILSNFNGLLKLLSHQTISFEQLCLQNLDIIKEMLNYCDSYIELTEHHYFNLNQLFVCEHFVRKLLLTHPHEATYLVSNDIASAHELMELPASHLLEALSNPYDEQDLELIIPSAQSMCMIL